MELAPGYKPNDRKLQNHPSQCVLSYMDDGDFVLDDFDHVLDDSITFTHTCCDTSTKIGKYDIIIQEFH